MSSGKMLPVHCSIETVDLPQGKEKDGAMEGYAIVPSTLLLKELVRVALCKLDYPKDQVRNATGKSPWTNGRLWNARWQQTYQVNCHCLCSSEHARITENNVFYLVSLLPPSVPKVPHSGVSHDLFPPLWGLWILITKQCVVNCMSVLTIVHRNE